MDDLPIGDSIAIAGDEISVRRSRSSGPGGQRTNKVETKVELVWSPGTTRCLSAEDRQWLVDKLAGRLNREGQLVVSSQVHREQSRNLAEARRQLAGIVAEALARPTPRKQTRPTRASVERRLRDKQTKSQRKRDRRVARSDEDE